MERFSLKQISDDGSLLFASNDEVALHIANEPEPVLSLTFLGWNHASIVVVNGTMFASAADKLWRVPLKQQIVTDSGIREFLKWPGTYTLAKLHDNSTVAAVCDSGIVLFVDVNDSGLRFIVYHSVVSEKCNEVVDFALSVSKKKIVKDKKGKCSSLHFEDAIFWKEASKVPALGAQDHLIVQFKRKLQIFLVPFVTITGPMLEEKKMIETETPRSKLLAAAWIEATLVIVEELGMFCIDSVALEEMFFLKRCIPNSCFIEMKLAETAGICGNNVVRNDCVFDLKGTFLKKIVLDATKEEQPPLKKKRI